MYQCWVPIKTPKFAAFKREKAPNQPPLMCQIFGVRASTHWTDRLSPNTVAITMPTYFWKETQSRGEFLTLNICSRLQEIPTWWPPRLMSYIHPQDKNNIGTNWGACSVLPGDESLRLANTHRPLSKKGLRPEVLWNTMQRPITSSTESPCHFTQQHTDRSWTSLKTHLNTEMTHTWINRVHSSLSKGSNLKDTLLPIKHYSCFFPLPTSQSPCSIFKGKV